MAQVYIVVKDSSDCEPHHPSSPIITFEEYLSLENTQQRVRIINLCQEYSYLSEGYYCSLLAEARGHQVIPSIRVLNDISQPLLYQIQLRMALPALEKALKGRIQEKDITIKSYFGMVSDSSFQPLARLLFENFPCPVLSFSVHYDGRWEVNNISIINHRDLNDEERTTFSNALEHFSSHVWREHKQKRSGRYDIAILVNEEEQLRPSNPLAIRKFIAAGKRLGVHVDVISPADFMRIPEYDALFIRETTSISHHTYRFAKRAEAEGLVVIDDPTSIIRCTNKIFLAKLFETHQVSTPKTIILQKGKEEQVDQAISTLGFPLVLKIPDGAFSLGVVKVASREELCEKMQELFLHSSLLLAQEYLYTEFDWRIGVLNNKPLYACRYYMAKNHWQIYNHGKKRLVAGGFDTLPTFEVPKYILQAALKATKPIGNGLYGVDIKESAGKGYVIEVNDNPSIDAGVEDRYLGGELYSLIIQDIIQRVETKRQP